MPAQFTKYRGRPILVDAVQLTERNAREIKDLIGKGNYIDKPWDPINLYIDTGHGEAVAVPGAWVVKDSDGKFYPCEDNIFQKKYEAASGK